MSNIAKRLGHWALERRLEPAVVEPGRSLSFGALDDESARLAAGLTEYGVRRGERVALLVPPGAELFAMAFALFRMGAVPVLIDPGVGWQHLRNCLGQAAPKTFIGTPKAHVGRLFGSWAKDTLERWVVVGGYYPNCRGLASLRASAQGARAPEVPEPGELAAVLYTSGSTGEPKGALYTHEMLGAQIDRLGGLFGCKAGETSVATFPLFALFDLCLGMTVVLPKMDFTKPGSVDPEAVLSCKGDQLFGSPALLDRLRGRRLEFKRILTAGAPVRSKILAGLDTEAKVYTPYGATEALPVAVIERSELKDTAAATASGAGVCVGKPVIEVKIIQISDAAETELREVARGTMGEIAVKGDVVSAGYLGRPDADKLSKIGPWHRMGDLGYFDETGRLWFCGRKSQRVGELATVRVEGVFNAHPSVRRAALVAGPTICIELEEGVEASEALRRELAGLDGRVKKVLFHKGFPVDARHNAKIKREELAVWASGQ